VITEVPPEAGQVPPAQAMLVMVSPSVVMAVQAAEGPAGASALPN
jgi:hypothetical protein